MKYLRVRQDFYPNVLGISPSQLANGDDVTFFLVHLDVLVAPKPDKISRKRCIPTVALLNEAPRGLREVVEKSGRDPKDSALYSLRIGGTSTTVAGEKYQIE